MAKEHVHTDYDEFKFFKDIYTRLNQASNIMLRYNSDISDTDMNGTIPVKVLYKKDSYYILNGEIHIESDFTRWINEYHKTIRLDINMVKAIKTCLKKNVIEAKASDDNLKFIFKFLVPYSKDSTPSEKEELAAAFTEAESCTTVEGGIEVSIAFSNIETTKKLEKEYPISTFTGKIYSIDKKIFDKNIFILYYDEILGSVSTKKIGKKILEFPSKMILPYNKTYDSYNIKIGEVINDSRLVQISNTDGILTLSQTFATI